MSQIGKYTSQLYTSLTSSAFLLALIQKPVHFATCHRLLSHHSKLKPCPSDVLLTKTASFSDLGSHSPRRHSPLACPALQVDHLDSPALRVPQKDYSPASVAAAVGSFVRLVAQMQAEAAADAAVAVEVEVADAAVAAGAAAAVGVAADAEAPVAAVDHARHRAST